MPSLEDLWLTIVSWVSSYILEPAHLTRTDVAPFFSRVPEFATILIIFFLVGRGLGWTLARTLLSRKRVDPMVGRLVGRLVLVLLMFVGFSVALSVFGINIFGLALTVGLIGAALALGLQNTVANIMGGISLVVDRPFEVGDRVKVGDFWGDVEEIGLRSTRILTTRREYVIVPNRLMDEREIWNYTKRYPELRIDIPVTISYDSDHRLARSIMERLASEQPQVLAFPRPRVLMTALAENGMQLELQCCIADARDRTPVAAELREKTKEAFDAGGVEIPFPYTTIVYKKDLPVPRHLDQRPEPMRAIGRRRLLVATAGTTPALNKAQTIALIAKELKADLVVAYIAPKASQVTRHEGERAAAIFNAAAEPLGVRVRLVVREGVIVQTIARLVREEKCGAVVIGASRTPVILAWKSANVEERLRQALRVPIVVVPPSLDVDPAEVELARRSLDVLAPVEPPAGSGADGAPRP